MTFLIALLIIPIFSTINFLTLHHSPKYFDLVNLINRDLKKVFVQHYKISPFAFLNGSTILFLIV
jgi:uncharacterized membrane protein